MRTAKDEVRTLLDSLPDDCSLEDIQYHLYALEKVRRGEERARNEGIMTQQEAEEHFRWALSAGQEKEQSAKFPGRGIRNPAFGLWRDRPGNMDAELRRLRQSRDLP